MGIPVNMAGSAESPGDAGARPKWLLLLIELRAPFFTASIVPVVLGTSVAFYDIVHHAVDLLLSGALIVAARPVG
jgi:hypothetical protein